MLVGDDAVGGFFAIDGGAFGAQPGHVCYLAPDTLEWMSLELRHSEWIGWLLHGDLATFYADVRWEGWQQETRDLSGDMAFSFYPFLSTGPMPVAERSRLPVPIQELYHLHVGDRGPRPPAGPSVTSGSFAPDSLLRRIRRFFSSE